MSRRIYFTERDPSALPGHYNLEQLERKHALQQSRGRLERVTSFIPNTAEIEELQLPARLIRPEEIEFSKDIKKLEDFFTPGKLIRMKNNSDEETETTEAMVSKISTTKNGAHKIKVIYNDNGIPKHKYIPALSAVAYNHAPFAEKHGETMARVKDSIDFLIQREGEIDRTANEFIGAHVQYKGKNCYVLGTEGHGKDRVFVILFEGEDNHTSDRLSYQSISLESFARSAKNIQKNALPKPIAENWYNNTTLGHYRSNKAA